MARTRGQSVRSTGGIVPVDAFFMFLGLSNRKLEPEQYRRLGQEAQRLGISASALIRRLIDEHLGDPGPADDDPLAAMTGIGHGGGEAISNTFRLRRQSLLQPRSLPHAD
jgi:hypothetical protein